MITDWQVPTRSGPKPSTTPVNPHSQLDQTAPVELQDRLRDHALALPGVRRGGSQISVPGAVAFSTTTSWRHCWSSPSTSPPEAGPASAGGDVDQH